MHKMYSVYDSKVQSYERPWIAPNKGSALRAVLDVFKDPNHPFTKWPADFTIFEIGEWDETTGTMIPYQTKVNCGVMIELIPIAQASADRPRDVSPVQATKNPTKEDSNHGRKQISQLQS